MPVEPNLHDLFRSATESEHPADDAIDAKAVIRRSRRRRLPAQLGVGSVFTLAIAGVGVAGITGMQGLGGGNGGSQDGAVGAYSPAQEATPNGASSPVRGATPDLLEGGTAAPSTIDGDIKRASADKINFCGAPLAEVSPHPSGLELTVDFPDAKVGAERVEGMVTLSNNGTETVRGSSAVSPAVTLSQEGITLWHSNGPMIAMAIEVELAPGESHEYPAWFTPVICTVEDDAAESFRPDLPAAPAGEYQLSAAIDFVMGSDAELIVGPLGTVTLHG